MTFHSTRDVAKILGITPSRLSRAVWTGCVDEPQRGPGGAFFWTESDMRRAAWILLHRDLDAVVAGARGGQS